MSIGTPNGILDITGATLRVSKMEFRQSTGFDTVLNNVARNTMLLMDETEQTTSNSWALKLPNAWVGEFHGYWASGSSGAPILFNFYNDSTSGTNGYTLSMDDTTISINYDGGSTLGSATLSSTLNNDTYRKVTIIFERNVLDVSIDGEHVFSFVDSQLRDRVYDNNSGYVTFTHSSTDERKLKNLKFTNGGVWTREIDSSNIAYVGGNVGIGTTVPEFKLDVKGSVNANYLIGDGSALSGIQSSNVSDFASNVTRIETLETDLGSNVTRIETLETDLGSNVTRIGTLETDLGDNSSRITNIESGDITITGVKTFQNDIILESNLRVQGDLLVANTVNMTVSDPILELGSNNLNTGDIGVIMTRHGASDSNVAIFYDESEDILKLGYTLNGANDTTIALDSNALAVAIQGNVEVGTANLFVDTTTSNVGIGTTTPGYSLDVVGDINLSGDFYQGGSPFVSSLWTDGANSLYYRSNVEVGTANLFVDTVSGNVGVGTTTPAYSLDVVGSAYFENIFMSGYVTHTLLNEAEFVWDPSSYLSYPGTGSTVYDINGNMNATITNTDYYGESWRTTASNSEIKTASNMDLRRDWTILLWHHPPGNDTNSVRIVGHGQAAGSSGLHILSSSTTIMRYGMYGNDIDFGYSNGHINRDRWRQYAFTYYHNGGVAGGVNRQVYQDERLVCDGQAGIGDGTNFPTDNYNPGGNFASLGYQPYQASPTVLRFGTVYGSGNNSTVNNWFGPILFFDRVLTASEIRSLYRFYSMRFSHN